MSWRIELAVPVTAVVNRTAAGGADRAAGFGAVDSTSRGTGGGRYAHPDAASDVPRPCCSCGVVRARRSTAAPLGDHVVGVDIAHKTEPAGALALLVHPSGSAPPRDEHRRGVARRLRPLPAKTGDPHPERVDMPPSIRPKGGRSRRAPTTHRHGTLWSPTRVASGTHPNTRYTGPVSAGIAKQGDVTSARQRGRRTTVNAIAGVPKKQLKLFSGRSHPEFGEEVAEHLNVTVTAQNAYEFANGELFVRYDESVRGCDAFVLQSHFEPVNDAIMEQLIMLDALKRASAKRVTVVAPFYGYARQDKKHKGREPISARLMADLFEAAGADRIMTVDLHTAQIQGFFNGPVDHLLAQNVLSDYVRRSYRDERITVVSPDAGRVRVAERWADDLGGTPLAFVHKSRDPGAPNQVETHRIVGDVQGRLCVVVDDIIDTGGTITKATEELLRTGAKDVVIAATHGVLSGAASQRLSESGAREVVLTNTLPIPPEHRFPRLTVLSIAPLVARAIHEVFENGSVTSLFNGDA